jgi:farnesyl diphosphate synthase
MVFNQSLAQSAQLVEARLAALLDTVAAGGAPERLVAAMRHATLGGGKRFRPFLTFECAALFGVGADQAVEAAAAIECVHCYSLVHDDLPAMDNDDLRRGQPTVHKAYDEWTAILAGDALLTLAFEVLAAPAAHTDPAIRAQLTAGLARAGGGAGMVGGQYLDLTAEKLGTPPQPSTTHVQRLQAMKTGALIAFSCKAGALLGSAGTAERRAVAGYGERLGLAFQIADDVLDSAIDETTAGKSVGHDLQEGKLTLPVLLACEADPELGVRIRKLLGEHGVPAAVAGEILADVRAAGGVDRARRKASALADEAVNALETLPASDYRDALRALAHLSADRSS